jgi:tetratricopeptide (TPR) repeat protein
VNETDALSRSSSEVQPAGDKVVELLTGDARYEQLREVGRGGIGVVYRGRDRVLGREIAIKVLRGGQNGRPDARRRFIQEAQIGSRLQHPAIVPVHELGQFPDGRPYFTMKLVEGETLAHLLRNRVADAAPADLSRLLAVFEQVCQAMAYAHANGVVHRDLKPSNVMVGAFGEVQVMDWGLAKQLGTTAGQPAGEESPAFQPTIDDINPAAATQSGTLMGTPAYMPPEQARGEVDRVDKRSDVFSLGAILCEILTGQPPYAGDAIETCRLAAEGDLTDAQARLASCGVDEALRSLAQQCLNADPEARPADAGIIAAGVTAYLSSAAERLRHAEMERAAAEASAKVERRARRLTLALAAALLVGAGVTAWQAVVANRAKDDAVSAAAAAHAAAAAEQVAKEAAQAKKAETDAVLYFVNVRILAAARPEGQDGGLGPNVTLRRAIEAAVPFVDKAFTDQPLTEARLRVTLGGSFHYLDENRLAATQFERAKTLYEDRLGPNHADTLEATNGLANCLMLLGDHSRALKLHEAVLAGRQATLGPDHPDTLMSINNLQNSFHHLGQSDRARMLLEEVLPRFKAVRGPKHPDTLMVMDNLATSYSELDRHADALALREQTLELRRAVLPPAHPQILMSMSALANSYTDARRFDDALKLFEETLELSRSHLGQRHRVTTASMTNLANCYFGMRRYQDALKLFRETLAAQREKYGPDSGDALTSLNNLAMTHRALGQPDEAVPLLEEALTRRRAKFPTNHPETMRVITNLATCYDLVNRQADSLRLLEELLVWRKAKSGPDAPETRALLTAIASRRLRLFAQAGNVAGCRAAVELWESLGRTDAASLYSSARYRAITAAVVSKSDAAAAKADADRAMEWLKKAVAAGYKDVARMKRDKDLDALRDRDDFKALVTELERPTVP